MYFEILDDKGSIAITRPVVTYDKKSTGLRSDKSPVISSGDPLSVYEYDPGKFVTCKLGGTSSNMSIVGAKGYAKEQKVVGIARSSDKEPSSSGTGRATVLSGKFRARYKTSEVFNAIGAAILRIQFHMAPSTWKNLPEVTDHIAVAEAGDKWSFVAIPHHPTRKYENDPINIYTKIIDRCIIGKVVNKYDDFIEIEFDL